MRLIMEGFRAWAGLDKEAEPEEELEPEEEDKNLSEEGQLAMLALHDDEVYRNMGLDLFRSSEHLDLDLLAAELDKRLHAAYDKYERDAGALRGVGLGGDPWGVLMDWIGYLKLGEDFISGDGINKEVRLSQDLYKLGSAQDMIARSLKQTASLWREP